MSHQCEVEGCAAEATHVLFWREEYRCLHHYREHYNLPDDWEPEEAE